ncbi:MAG TPA: hypothetical protein VMP86_06570 [Candidatus Binatia bacterium]|nr:hypothetical protein [Candidatus Binatia bacterium]
MICRSERSSDQHAPEIGQPGGARMAHDEGRGGHPSPAESRCGAASAASAISTIVYILVGLSAIALLPALYRWLTGPEEATA